MGTSDGDESRRRQRRGTGLRGDVFAEPAGVRQCGGGGGAGEAVGEQRSEEGIAGSDWIGDLDRTRGFPMPTIVRE